MQKLKRRAYINRDRLPVIVVVLSVAILLFGVFLLNFRKGDAPGDIDRFSAETKDGAIELSWRNPKMEKGSAVALQIQSEGTDLAITLPAYADSYTFLGGEHGTAYTFTVSVTGADGHKSKGQQGKAMFLNLNAVPDLPLLSIQTVNGEEPACVLDEKPEGCVGVGITGNEYVKGELSLIEHGDTQIHTQMRFRIRGNTPDRLKTPYKIKLDRALDLLQREDESYQDTDWALLSYGTDFVFPAGLFVSRLCQFEWQPAFEFVNLMVNGDWRGCYLLVESVGRGEGRLDVSDDGFIIENDAYWWNTGGAYFKTDKLQNEKHREMGYTFKYPDIADDTDERLLAVKQYMDAFETALYNGDPSYSEYIDVQSFANWLLFQDIMASWDGSGTNMFLYKYDFDPQNPTSTKIKMGPAWDLESACTEEYRNRWATVHENSVMYFKQLLTFSDFKDAYKASWREVSGGLWNETKEYLNRMLKEKGEALRESWQMDGRRWGYEITDPYEQAEELVQWFAARESWMEQAVSGL